MLVFCFVSVCLGSCFVFDFRFGGAALFSCRFVFCGFVVVVVVLVAYLICCLLFI